MPNRIIFVSPMNREPWGGSEELWARSALDLLEPGFPVSTSVLEWSPLHPRVLDLRARGVHLWVRLRWYSLREHPWDRLASRGKDSTADGVGQLIAAR